MLEDTEGIGEKSSQDVELFEVENQRMSQDYIDPVNTYMEKFFNTRSFSISSIFPIFQVYQIFCGEDHAGNYSQAPLVGLVLTLIKSDKEVKLSEKMLDWLHWHFSIT